MRARRGAVLVEFAFIALAFYLLLAGTFEVGRMVFTSQVLQNAARVGARELALVPLPAAYTFDRAIGIDPPLNALTPGSPDYENVTRVRQTVFDPGLLAYRIDDPNTLQTQLDGWPALNRMLQPLMIRETINGQEWLHYPGVLVSDPTDSDDGTTVAVPQVVRRAADGAETIRWTPVVEEVKADVDPLDGFPDTGPFSMLSTAPQRGLVALRINYPFQASTLVAYNDDPSTPFPNDAVIASDGSVSVQNPGDVSIVATADGDAGVYTGQFGLGVLLAEGKEVRPFSRFLTAQSMFRREIFK